jgi:hypothetical protein
MIKHVSSELSSKPDRVDLVIGSVQSDKDYEDIYQAICGIIFLATPIKGQPRLLSLR